MHIDTIRRNIITQGRKFISSFRISVRMNANNNKLLIERELLIDVIIKLCRFQNLSEAETEKLQKGRKFLNQIKHQNNKFRTWPVEISDFEIAFEIMKKYQLNVTGG